MKPSTVTIAVPAVASKEFLAALSAQKGATPEAYIYTQGGPSISSE